MSKIEIFFEFVKSDYFTIMKNYGKTHSLKTIN